MIIYLCTELTVNLSNEMLMLMTKSIKGKNLDPQEQSPGVLYQKYLFTSVKFWAKKALRRNPFEYFFRNVSNYLLEFVKTVSCYRVILQKT